MIKSRPSKLWTSLSTASLMTDPSWSRNLWVGNGSYTMISSAIILWLWHSISLTSVYNKRPTRRTAILSGPNRPLNGRYITTLGSGSCHRSVGPNGRRTQYVVNYVTALVYTNTSTLTRSLRKVAIGATTSQTNRPQKDCFHSGTRLALHRSTTASTNVQSARNARWPWSSASANHPLTSGSRPAWLIHPMRFPTPVCLIQRREWSTFWMTLRFSQTAHRSTCDKSSRDYWFRPGSAILSYSFSIALPHILEAGWAAGQRMGMIPAWLTTISLYRAGSLSAVGTCVWHWLANMCLHLFI